MGRISDIIARGHGLLESLDPASITIGGQTVACLASGIRTARGDAEAGGFMGEYQGTITIRKALLDSAPVSGAVCVFEGSEYYIGSVTEDGSTYTVALEARNRHVSA